MATPTVNIRQDLPPPGGYQPINYKRIPAKTYMSGRTMFLIYAFVQTSACFIWLRGDRKLTQWKVEARSGNMATIPMLQAEKDRAYLKVIRKNRDLETELMKDVPGWEVGTYYGDKIYWTRPDNEWHDITTNEYFVHAYKSDLNYHCNFFKYL
ncbi:unnamed protein product [Allacma fusca]|uniref:NADH dehydrogenase [ubiquinone] 1 alpha subcomplex subunit 13 n=1 Tax=Allacma fusca TaxID=39272 RepID=A0A8J2NMZ5_9HEXA|nr:unnamed protein product [Allacma fusca]